ncbi:MAG: MATE family efflux transporter [Verrucomicrobiales bacterium]|nr:MATE family efflux transporter [Verrucomicrobiales bacterium]
MKTAPSLTTDSILRLTWRIAVPSSVGMFFNTLFNFVDTYCAGLLGTEALAALSVSFPLFFLMIAVGSGLSQGATAMISHALGAGDLSAARRWFAQSIVFGTGAGVILTAFGLLLAPDLFRWLGAEGRWLSETLSYVNLIFAGAVFFVLCMTLNAGLSAQGETRVYRDFLIAGFVANCLLNPLFMWGFAFISPMGVAGLALSTVIIQIGGSVLLWSRLRKTVVAQGLLVSDFRPHLSSLREVAAQSVPAALNMMTIAFGILVMVWYVKHFGQAAVAAIGIATRIEQIVLMPAIGLGTAMLSIVGQNHGAGLPFRVREAWITNIRLGAGMMLAGGVLLWTLGAMMMRIFTDDPEVIRNGTHYLKAAAITLAAYPILFVTVFMMQGLKRPGYGLWVGIYRQIAAPIVIYHAFAFTLGWGLHGIWWGMAVVTWSAAYFALGWGWKVCRELTMPSKVMLTKIMTP